MELSPGIVATPPLVEVCVAGLEAATVAVGAGADRLELNSALPLGGLTPSAGLVRTVLAAVRVPVVCMARPRPGGFCYSRGEWQTLLAETEAMLEAGVQGIAFGVLDENSSVDNARCGEFARRFGAACLVFHRAFDLTPDPEAALEQLVDCGVQRILTSGQQSTALAGAACLRRLAERSRGRIELLPGGGINPENAVGLLRETGLNSLHGSFSLPRPDPGYPPPGGLRFAADDQPREPDPDAIRRLKRLHLPVAPSA